MLKLISNIYSRPEALEELKSWNLELDKSLLDVCIIIVYICFHDRSFLKQIYGVYAPMKIPLPMYPLPPVEI